MPFNVSGLFTQLNATPSTLLEFSAVDAQEGILSALFTNRQNYSICLFGCRLANIELLGLIFIRRRHFEDVGFQLHYLLDLK